MRRKLLAAALPLLIAIGMSGTATAHECDPNTGDCKSTTQVGNWRGNYIPLFDLADRNNEDELDRAQRWRDECEGYNTDGEYYNNQFCLWQEFGTSAVPGPGGELAPNEVHVGTAGSHCFLFEAMHDCEDHNPYDEDANYNPNRVHDAHGGAIYIDICLVENPDSRWCKKGLEDTTIGITVMDHNGCGIIIPVASCTDEYHVLKPFNSAYTAEQMADTMDWLNDAAADPQGFLRWYLCGFGPGSEDCVYQG
jgi:hypothetical protein